MSKRYEQRGQAMAEYQVLFPAGILLSSFLLPIIAIWGRAAFCRVARGLDTSVCAAEFAPVEEVMEAMDGEEDTCVVYPMSEGGSACDQTGDCVLLDTEANTGYFYSADLSQTIESFVIKAGQGYFIYTDGYTPDGCYFVDFSDDGRTVTWSKEGDSKDCQDVSHTEVWYVTLCVEE